MAWRLVGGHHWRVTDAKRDAATDFGDVLAATFPRALRSDVARVAQLIGPGSGYERLSDESVLVDGERIGILRRLYVAEPAPEAVAHLTERQQLIVSALYSRHADGLIRERHLPRLFVDVPWAPHFLLLLVSEYVIEIGHHAVEIRDPIPTARYAALAAENPEFLILLRSRIISYWREFYDPRRYPQGVIGLYGFSRSVPFTAYPGYRFLAARGLWTGAEARRLISADERRRPA